MAEERIDSPAPRRRARYRFEYGRTGVSWTAVPIALGVAAAGVLSAMAWMNMGKPVVPPPKPPAPVEPATPQLQVALKPVRAEMPPVRSPTPERIAPAAAPPATPALVPPLPPPTVTLPPPAPPPLPTPVMAVAAAPAPAAPPVDPCASIRGVVERHLCSDPTVRALDQRVDAAYRNALALTDNRGKVEREHARWLARRGEVGPGRTAVLAYYEQRYREVTPVPMRVGPRLPPIVKPKPQS